MKTLNYFSESPWYFAHIPKSGGTTFSAFFDRLFNKNEIFPQQLLWEVGAISTSSNIKYNLFRGHFNTFGAQLAYRATHDLTILRNPIDMAFSSYKHVCQNKKSRLHNKVVGEKWSFEDFIFSSESKNLISNRMTKFLHLGANVPFEHKNIILNKETFRKYKRSIKSKQHSPNIEDKYTLALDYLKRCFWVGVLEEMPRSLNVLCYALALPPIKEIPVLNQSVRKGNVSEKAIKHLEQVNEYDLKLFEWAKHQLDEDEVIIRENLGEKLTAKLLDESYQNKHLSHFNKSLQSEIDFTMDQCLIGDQWYQREYDENSQSIFRWSGPASQSFIDFWLCSRDYDIEIIVSKHCLEDWNQLTIDVNEKMVAYTVSKNNEGWKLVAKVSSDMIKTNGLMRLTFSQAQNLTHAEVFGDNDQRQVGIALNRVIIK